MTIDKAIRILDQATEPANQGRMTREGYWQCEEALRAIREALKPKEEPKE